MYARKMWAKKLMSSPHIFNYFTQPGALILEGWSLGEGYTPGVRAGYIGEKVDPVAKGGVYASVYM